MRSSNAYETLLELPSRDEEKVDAKFVTALARGLEILRVFDPKDGPLGNQELAERCGLPKPTVSRITYTLTKLGYLEYLPRLSKYRIGLGVLALGHTSVSSAALVRAARPHMQELAKQTDAMVALGGRDRLSMVYLDVCRSKQTASFSLDAGARIPVFRSAMGMAYLWAIAENARNFLLDAIKKRLADEWPSFSNQLDQAFQSLESQGFCVAKATYERSISGVGVPLVLQDGDEVYAVTCSAPSFQLTADRLEKEVGPRLVAAVSAIRTDLEGFSRHSY